MVKNCLARKDFRRPGGHSLQIFPSLSILRQEEKEKGEEVDVKLPPAADIRDESRQTAQKTGLS